MPRRMMLATSLVLLAAGHAMAAGDVAEGRATAQRWCANCHAVEPSGRGADVAPSFATVAQSRDVEYLRGFLSRPHPPMPRYELSRQDIDDLIAFIESQKPR